MAYRYREMTISWSEFEAADERGKKTKRYDWNIFYTDGSTVAGLEEVLNHEASAGWRLLSIVPLHWEVARTVTNYDMTKLKAIFERND